MQLDVLSDPQSLFAFALEWAEFVGGQHNLTPFQDPEWLLTWWSHFGSGQLRVLVLRELACTGVVPCFLHEWNGARQLTLMGSGITDYLDPVIDNGHKTAVLHSVAEYLRATDEWDVCDWQDISADSPLLSLAPALAGTVKTETPCTEAVFLRDFDSFWKSRPRHLRRNVRRYGDKAREQGHLEFSASADAAPALLGATVRLHTSRWNEHGQPGMIRLNNSAAFLQHIAERFACRNMLRIFSLRHNVEIAAVILGFVCRGKLYGYLTGSDPQYRHLSLGSILLFEAMRHCAEEGLLAWNFCRGNEPYKTDWGATAIPRCRLLLEAIAR